MKTSIFFIILFFGLQSARAQQRFQSFVFENAEIDKNHYYVDQIPESIKSKSYRFDFYQPKNDSLQSRPLIIWMHGGGFKLGSENSRGIPIWSKRFAQRGYVCAAINYRKSKKKPLSRFDDLVEGCIAAVQDLSLAIDYFKRNADKWGIDTNRIFLAGNSAGGMIALQAVYSTPRLMASLAKLPDTASYSEQNNFQHISGIINFWGGIFDTAWLKNAKVPIVMVHGVGDNIVPYKKDEAPLYGSFFIHQQADALNIPNALKAYEGFRHELQKRFFPFLAFSGAHRKWKEAGQFAADFLYETVMKSN